MNKEKVNKQRLRECLYQIDDLEVLHFPDNEHAGWDDFGRGLICGLVEAMMACGLTFEESCGLINECIDDGIRIGAVPEIWQEVFAEQLVQPPIPEMMPLFRFLVEQGCEPQEASGPHIGAITPNGLFYSVLYNENGTYTELLDNEETVFNTVEDLKFAWN